MAGINFISVIIGLFAMGEVLINVEQQSTRHLPGRRSMDANWADIKQCRRHAPLHRVGFFLGLLPGCSPR